LVTGEAEDAALAEQAAVPPLHHGSRHQVRRLRSFVDPKEKLYGKTSGVNVIITIFSDFSQFSAKKSVFIGTQRYDQFFA
jgi:hypothetical protein